MKRFAILAVAMTSLVSACADDGQAVAAQDTAKPTIQEARANAAKNDKMGPAPVRVADAKSLAKPQHNVDVTDRKSAKDPALVAAGDKIFKAGQHYTVLTPAQRTSSPAERVEVTEVFMYQCPHCFSFEGFVNTYLAKHPAEVNFVRLPAIFNNVAKLHAQAYYTSLSMGVWEKLHTPFFREIHTKRNLMPTEDKLLDFIEGQGINRDAFATAMKSFDVDSKVRDALELNRRYRIQSVPTVVINGKYVTSGQMAGSEQQLAAVIDYLVAKESLEL